MLVIMFCFSDVLAQPKSDSVFNGVDTSSQFVTLDTIKVTAVSGSPVYQATAPVVWNIHHTRAAISFDTKRRIGFVSEWISMSPHCYNTDTVQLDAKTIVFDSVALQIGKRLIAARYTYNKDKLTVYFDSIYTAADTAILYLKYTSRPYDLPTGGSTAITDDRGLYFINGDNSIPNKPIQIWTQGETESNSHWLVTVDKPNSRFTTQLELTVSDTFTTLSNGLLIKQLKRNNGLRTDIWRMDQPIQAYAVMFAAGKYVALKDKWKGKEVSYYVEPQYAKYGKQMFANTPEMIDFFSQYTGIQYPWPKYSQIVVRDYVSGAMENTSASLFGEFMNMNAREIADKSQENVVAHELFHQWFGDYVTAESWSNLTLNESFANYGEQLWKAYKYGKESADELAFADLQGYLQSSAYHDPQLVRFYYDDREDMFDAISYNKGGAILRYLNNLAGEAAFRKAMTNYLSRNALHSAEANNWRMAIEEATGRDWNWFFNQWYYHSGHPVLKINYLYNDTTHKLKVIVSQENTDSPYLYNLPLTAALLVESDHKIIDWVVQKRIDTFTYDYPKNQRPVFIPDYYHVLPGTIRDKKDPKQWLLQYQYTSDFLSKRASVVAAGTQIADSLSQLLIDMAIKDRNASIRRLALAQIEDLQTAEYRKRWKEKVKEIALSDTDIHVKAEALDILGNWGDSSAVGLFIKYCSDSSYAVAAAALIALDKKYPDSAYRIAVGLINRDIRSVLESTVYMIVAKHGREEDVRFFEKHAPFVFNTRKYALASAIATYAEKSVNDSSFLRSLDVLRKMIQTEPMKNIRANITDQIFYLGTSQRSKLTSDDKSQVARAKARLPMILRVLTNLYEIENDLERKGKIEAKIKELSEKS